MEKRIKRIELYYRLSWDGLTEISDIEKDLEEIKKIGATHVEIGAFDECSVYVQAICEREETDEEFEVRKFQEKLNAERKRQRELDLLVELKAKYE